MSALSIATATEVFDLFREDLTAVEAEFSRQSDTAITVVSDIASYLIAGGGKRIRPLLLLMAAKACGSRSQARIRLGAVVEMLHTATLVHDDIIDEASTRRGRPSSNTTWGNSKCVLAGDWLYMQAFHSALEERNFRVLDLLISLTQQMVEGELLQMQKLGHLINEEEYFDLIFRKTARLFQVSMQLGAVVAHGSSRSSRGSAMMESAMMGSVVNFPTELQATSCPMKMPWANMDGTSAWLTRSSTMFSI